MFSQPWDPDMESGRFSMCQCAEKAKSSLFSCLGSIDTKPESPNISSHSRTEVISGGSTAQDPALQGLSSLDNNIVFSWVLSAAHPLSAVCFLRSVPVPELAMVSLC